MKVEGNNMTNNYKKESKIFQVRQSLYRRGINLGLLMTFTGIISEFLIKMGFIPNTSLTLLFLQLLLLVFLSYLIYYITQWIRYFKLKRSIYTQDLI